VYEWEPVGVGGCGPGVGSASVVFVEGGGGGGCVGLVSSGTSPEESGFLDASAMGGRDGEGGEGGGDVFFFTSAPLVSADEDLARDVYDAHECGGGLAACFGVGVVSPPACSSGDSCRAAPSPQPEVFGAPASATFSGAGNPPVAGPVKVVKSAAQLRAEALARALKACRVKHNAGRRRACEARARKRYGPVKAAKKARRATRRPGRARPMVLVAGGRRLGGGVGR